MTSTATKLKRLIETGWSCDFKTVGSERQITCTHERTGETLVFSGRNNTEAVNNAYEGIGEGQGQERAS